MTRTEALAQSHAETLRNGRCVGQLENDPDNGTVLAVIYCECQNGTHVWDSEPGDMV